MTDAELSKLLYLAREAVDMWADFLESRVGHAPQMRQLVADLDLYRAERGWSPHGFGGEESTRGRVSWLREPCSCP